jgi:anti-sigma regulatory factor (Ser/Thr protein kinase)
VAEPTVQATGHTDTPDIRSNAITHDATHAPVELILSVKDDLLVLARLAASTVASRAGFDIEEIEDLRLAVDELCLHVLHGRRTGRLHLAVSADPGRIDVWCQFEGPDLAPDGELRDDGLGDLSARLLEALVDEHGPSTRGGLPGAFLCKRRSRSDG